MRQLYLSLARREQRNEELTNGPKTVKAVHSASPAISLSLRLQQVVEPIKHGVIGVKEPGSRSEKEAGDN